MPYQLPGLAQASPTAHAIPAACPAQNVAVNHAVLQADLTTDSPWTLSSDASSYAPVAKLVLRGPGLDTRRDPTPRR
jgi:hypothetical protein